MIFKHKTLSEQMEEIEAKLRTARLKQEMREFEKQRKKELEDKKRELRKLKYGEIFNIGKNLLDGLKKAGIKTKEGIEKIQKYNYEQEKKAKKKLKDKKNNYDSWGW